MMDDKELGKIIRMDHKEDLGELLRTKSMRFATEEHVEVGLRNPPMHELEAMMYAAIGGLMVILMLWLCGMLRV